jgi:predicted N-formylglutamate amidohydrolase
MNNSIPPKDKSLHHEVQEAFEIYGYNHPSRYLFSCEHASNRVPHPLVSTLSDQQDILHTHWAWDIGTKLLVQELIHLSQSQSIFARFTRLVVDANRHRNRKDLIVPTVENNIISFNQNLDETDVAWRLDTYYNPYHAAFKEMVANRMKLSPPFLLISVHSFTPVWKGKVRTMDIGVLYDNFEDTAKEFKEKLSQEGFFVELNQPYSGRFGLMYSVAQQGDNFQIPHLELEFNQAQICTPDRIKLVAKKVFKALEALSIP